MPVDKNYTNCRAMATLVLGMNDISDDPTKNIPPTLESPGILKKIYLGKISNMIYNDYICESEKATKIMKAILTQEEVRYSTVLLKKNQELLSPKLTLFFLLPYLTNR